MPRGGVPVGYEVARALRAPLEVFVVRKLGVPGHEELAMGAIASGGVRVLNRSVIESLGISDAAIDAITEVELRKLERRDRVYRGSRPTPDVRGRTVILVDDGIATGSTIRAAVQALRHLQVGHLVVAVPTAAWSSARALRPEVDELINVMTPKDLAGVGEWYEDFSQTTDRKVHELLKNTRPFPIPT